MSDVSAETWARTIGFYQQLIDENGWQQRPMLEFVSWLAASRYSQALHPSTSHESLGLACVPTFQERLGRPMVYIVYDAESGGFVIHWQRGQGDEVREERVPSPQAPDVFDRVLSWLGLADASHAEPGAATNGDCG